VNIGWEGEKSNGNTGREECIIKGGILLDFKEEEVTSSMLTYDR